MGEAQPWHEGRTWPDHERLGVTPLSKALLDFARGSTPRPPLPGIDWEDVEKVVVMVLDGLGLSQLEHAFEVDTAPNLEKARDGGGMSSLTTTLPSTTATALVSMSTATHPEEHGFLGFRLFLKEAGVLADMIRLTILGNDTRLDSVGLGPDMLMPIETVPARARRQGLKVYAITRDAFVESPFTKILYTGAELMGYNSCPELLLTVANLCRKEEKSLIFAYWDTIDIVCHMHGGKSDAFLDTFAKFDSSFGRELLQPGLGDVLFLLTADHGHIDCPRERTVDLGEHGELLSFLSLPPTGDARLPYLHVEQGRLRHVLDYLDEHLEHMAEWLKADEALRAGLFGPSGTSKWRDRLGDLILLPKEDYCFTYGYPPEEKVFVGRHGGTSPEEMLVPLLWCCL
ncbi:MAG: alkaline phosphatase family protein [Thermoplasmata archaeon]